MFNRVSVNILNGYPGTPLMTTTCFFVATFTQNYLHLKTRTISQSSKSKVCNNLRSMFKPTCALCSGKSTERSRRRGFKSHVWWREVDREREEGRGREGS